MLAKVTVDEANDGKVRLIIKGEGGNTALSYKLYAGRELVQEGALEEVQEPGAEWSIESSFTVAQPSLWYPRGFGKPFRYRLEIIAAQRGNIVDKWERQIGFKKSGNAFSSGIYYQWKTCPPLGRQYGSSSGVYALLLQGQGNAAV